MAEPKKTAGPPSFENAPPSFLEGVQHATSGVQYLGDGQVAYQVVQRLAKRAVETPQEAEAAVRDAARIFAGRDPAYRGVGDWNPNGLARWCLGHVNGLEAHPNPEDVIVDTLSHLVIQLWATARSRADEELKKTRTHALLQNWTCLMLGIIPEAAVPPLPDRKP